MNDEELRKLLGRLAPKIPARKEIMDADAIRLLVAGHGPSDPDLGKGPWRRIEPKPFIEKMETPDKNSIYSRIRFPDKDIQTIEIKPYLIHLKDQSSKPYLDRLKDERGSRASEGSFSWKSQPRLNFDAKHSGRFDPPYLLDNKSKLTLPLTDVVETLSAAMRSAPLTGKELVGAVAYVARELQGGRTVLPNQVGVLAAEAYIAGKCSGDRNPKTL